MTDYLFVFGNSSDLAEEEIAAIWPNFQISGGLVKLAEFFDEPIVDKLVAGREPGQRIIFGLSGDVPLKRVKDVKDGLEARGFKARFILPADGVELSSVVVAKQKVAEIYLIGERKAKTVWVQDFAGWNKRDYDRPAVDPHLGMLPPKVARMMVNIGLQGIADSEESKPIILDPFCGVGTILAEGLMVGAKVIGSDVNREQIHKSQENLDWLSRTYNLEPSRFQLRVSDARQASRIPELKSVDAIVTETYLGPDNQKFLEGLYYESLEDWRNILRQGGRVVIATPFPLDSQKLMGYSLAAGPFAYFRPQAKIRRHVTVLEIKN